MAKASKTHSSTKISFGKRRKGKYKKSFGPKEQRPKPYIGQGK